MLPAPNLDDRHFQDLVDDAKRLVQQRCPTWTDHNVSDPGVTLIEAFAQMVDQLIFRLNRVPDLHYIKFLELIGVELRSAGGRAGCRDLLAVGAPTAAGAGPSRVPGGHAAHRRQRPRGLQHDAGTGDRALLLRARRRPSRPAARRSTAPRRSGAAASAASPPPGPRRRAAGRAVQRGAELCGAAADELPGVRPRRRSPPASGGLGGVDRLRLGGVRGRFGRDRRTQQAGRRGAARAGEPPASIIARQRAGWLRCRLIEAQPDQPTYSASPTVVSIEAMTIGGTVPTVHAEVVRGEVHRPVRRHARSAVLAAAASRWCASDAPATVDGDRERRRGDLAGGAGRALRPVRPRRPALPDRRRTRARCSSGRRSARRTAG